MVNWTESGVWSVVVLSAVVHLATPLRVANAQAGAASGQVRDSSYTWRAYATIARCSISIFDIVDDAAANRSPRQRLVVLRELEDNPGPSATEDADYLVDRIGRDFGFDPAEAVFVFHWGGFSFGDTVALRNELFLRATYRRAKNGALSGPQWRVVRREDLEDLTDRAF